MPRGERLNKIWIVVAGVLSFAVAVSLAFVGVVQDGGYAWHSIETAIDSVMSGTPVQSGGYAWH